MGSSQAPEEPVRRVYDEVVIRDDFEMSNGLAHPMTVELADGTLFTVLQGQRQADDGTVRHVVLGTRWTRGYQLPHGPNMPTPPARAASSAAL